jgi:hypothetical protein
LIALNVGAHSSRVVAYHVTAIHIFDALALPRGRALRSGILGILDSEES